MTDQEVGQFSRIEATVDQLVATVARLETLIREEIADLKREQIADLRKQNERISDDQRRAWEAIRELEANAHKSSGRASMVHASMSVLASLLSGGLVAFIIHSMH